MTTRADRVALVAEVLADEGGSPGNSLHSWRCQYLPDGEGCNCLEAVAELILDALDNLEPAVKPGV